MHSLTLKYCNILPLKPQISKKSRLLKAYQFAQNPLQQERQQRAQNMAGRPTRPAGWLAPALTANIFVETTNRTSKYSKAGGMHPQISKVSKIDCLSLLCACYQRWSFKAPFLWWPLAGLMKQTRHAVCGIKQSILLTCLSMHH